MRAVWAPGQRLSLRRQAHKRALGVQQWRWWRLLLQSHGVEEEEEEEEEGGSPGRLPLIWAPSSKQGRESNTPGKN